MFRLVFAGSRGSQFALTDVVEPHLYPPQHKTQNVFEERPRYDRLLEPGETDVPFFIGYVQRI